MKHIVIKYLYINKVLFYIKKQETAYSELMFRDDTSVIHVLSTVLVEALFIGSEPCLEDNWHFAVS